MHTTTLEHISSSEAAKVPLQQVVKKSKFIGILCSVITESLLQCIQLIIMNANYSVGLKFQFMHHGTIHQTNFRTINALISFTFTKNAVFYYIQIKIPGHLLLLSHTL